MATKKKELLEQDTPVTETVMSEDETLPACPSPGSRCRCSAGPCGGTGARTPR